MDRLKLALLAALCVLAAWMPSGVGMAAPNAQVKADGVLPDTLTMYAGQAVVKTTPGRLRRVAVGNGELLEVKAVGSSELVLIANSPGDTSVELWMRDGSRRSVAVHIVAGNGEQVADAVRHLLGGDSRITVTRVGANVVLSGHDLPQADVARIAAIRKLYPQVLDFTSADNVQMKPMVMMKVRIMEFNKKAMNEIGIKWDTMIDGPAAGLTHPWITNPYYGVVREGSLFAGKSVWPGTQSYLGIATSITSKINLLMQTGKAWELATPQLAARSGGVADFLVGGEVPILIAQGLGDTTVEYKKYGIQLHIEPVVNNTGDIAFNIETEVSRIDPSVNIKGYPGFITRRASAELNVHEGDTIVISGLVDATASKTFDKMPGLGQIPILGALFRSRNFQTARTDLVVFVTPVVVDPHSAENRRLLRKSERLKDDFRKTIGADIVD